MTLCPYDCDHCKTLAKPKNSLCETEDERQARIRSSKREYYQRNKERFSEYKKMHRNDQLPWQTPTQNTSAVQDSPQPLGSLEKQQPATPSLVLKVVSPSNTPP